MGRRRADDGDFGFTNVRVAEFAWSLMEPSEESLILRGCIDRSKFFISMASA